MQTKRVLQAFVGFSMLIFIVFSVIALSIGGDALSGKVEDGHYFLSNHGQLTEVTRQWFTYSKWHSTVLLGSWPFVMLSAWWLNRNYPQKPPEWFPAWVKQRTNWVKQRTK